MRILLNAKGESEIVIRKDLHINLEEKLKYWPKQLVGTDIKIPKEICGLLSFYREIRNEITHPKNKDHSVYRNLDKIWIQIDQLNLTIAEFIVTILESKKEIFPYWLTGWNFVVFNIRPTCLLQLMGLMLY